jgi:hypothetical protein
MSYDDSVFFAARHQHWLYRREVQMLSPRRVHRRNHRARLIAMDFYGPNLDVKMHVDLGPITEAERVETIRIDHENDLMKRCLATLGPDRSRAIYRLSAYLEHKFRAEFPPDDSPGQNRIYVRDLSDDQLKVFEHWVVSREKKAARRAVDETDPASLAQEAQRQIDDREAEA